MFRDVLDLLHDCNELVDAYQILSVGQEQTTYSECLLDNTRGKMVEDE